MDIKLKTEAQQSTFTQVLHAQALLLYLYPLNASFCQRLRGKCYQFQPGVFLQIALLVHGGWISDVNG